jgi:hypothetical protein
MFDVHSSEFGNKIHMKMDRYCYFSPTRREWNEFDFYANELDRVKL